MGHRPARGASCASATAAVGGAATGGALRVHGGAGAPCARHSAPRSTAAATTDRLAVVSARRTARVAYHSGVASSTPGSVGAGGTSDSLDPLSASGSATGSTATTFSSLSSRMIRTPWVLRPA